MTKGILRALVALAPLCAATRLLAQPTGVTATSRPIRLIRSWEETVKVAEGRDVPRRVEVLFDYDKGVGYEVYYGAGGAQTGLVALGAGHPSPSRAEIDEAFDVVRADPEFAKLKGVFEGGFLLTESPSRPCGPGSRCLRVFLLSLDRTRTIRQVVADLVKRRVVYDDFAPGSPRTGK
jgi:hypothetical protein